MTNWIFHCEILANKVFISPKRSIVNHLAEVHIATDGTPIDVPVLTPKSRVGIFSREKLPLYSGGRFCRCNMYRKMLIDTGRCCDRWSSEENHNCKEKKNNTTAAVAGKSGEDSDVADAPPATEVSNAFSLDVILT